MVMIHQCCSQFSTAPKQPKKIQVWILHILSQMHVSESTYCRKKSLWWAFAVNMSHKQKVIQVGSTLLSWMSLADSFFATTSLASNVLNHQRLAVLSKSRTETWTQPTTTLFRFNPPELLWSCLIWELNPTEATFLLISASEAKFYTCFEEAFSQIENNWNQHKIWHERTQQHKTYAQLSIY